jgi:hypothetical protein
MSSHNTLMQSHLLQHSWKENEQHSQEYQIWDWNTRTNNPQRGKKTMTTVASPSLTTHCRRKRTRWKRNKEPPSWQRCSVTFSSKPKPTQTSMSRKSRGKADNWATPNGDKGGATMKANAPPPAEATWWKRLFGFL